MAQIEQAVFSSAETDRMAGYQILGSSKGLHAKDIKELAAWGPSHDSLLETGPDATSFNFHRLASGNYCVSRTTAAGPEYSGRGGLRVYTQFLVMPPAELARFANNPFAVLRAALTGGELAVHEKVPRKLPAISLPGKAAAVDTALLARLQVKPGIGRLCQIIDAALDSPGLILAGGESAEHIIAGLINCLPPECRTEFSFSTGLVFSPRRPFRIVTMPVEEAQWRRRRHALDAAIIDLSQQPSDEPEADSDWSRLVKKTVAAGQTSFLAAQFSKRRFQLAIEDLPALALQLLEEWDATRLPPDEAENSKTSKFAEAKEAEDWLDCLQRAHAAHTQFQGAATAVAGRNKTAGRQKAKQIDTACPEILEKLELLDDIVFSAIGGNRAALEELRQIWPKFRQQLGDDLLAESREQYLHHALLIWQGSADPAGTRDPGKAIEALDVLSIIFGDS